MQQDVHRQYHHIVVNAQPATQPAAGTVTQPTCSTATGGFRLQAILHPIRIPHRVVSISGTGLVTHNGNVYFHKQCT
jgi:hypothetical protein